MPKSIYTLNGDTARATRRCFAAVVLFLQSTHWAAGFVSPEGDARRVQEACADLDSERVSAIQTEFANRNALGLSEADVLSRLRDEYEGNGLHKDYDRCIVAIYRMETANRERADRAAAAAKFRAMKAALTPKEKEWIAFVNAYRKSRIAELKDKIEDMRNSHYSDGSLPSKENELATLESNDPPIIPTITEDNVASGTMGRFDRALVDQVISDNEALITLRAWKRIPDPGRKGVRGRVVQGSDVRFPGLHGRVEFVKTDMSLWVTGDAVHGLVDGADFSSAQIFKITGTKTANGQTLHHAVQLNIDPKKLTQFMD